MKCMSKTIEYNVIEVTGDRNYYITIGKYLDEKFYELRKVKSERYYDAEEVILKKDGQEIIVENNHYILINSETGEFKYITKKEYETEYVEIVGG